MNCRTIEYVVELLRTGSLQEASSFCNVTPGTMSGQITRLEHYLGVTLFTSRSTPAQLNPEAEAIVARMQQVVEHMREIRRISRGMA